MILKKVKRAKRKKRFLFLFFFFSLLWERSSWTQNTKCLKVFPITSSPLLSSLPFTSSSNIRFHLSKMENEVGMGDYKFQRRMESTCSTLSHVATLINISLFLNDENIVLLSLFILLFSFNFWQKLWFQEDSKLVIYLFHVMHLFLPFLLSSTRQVVVMNGRCNT